MISAPPFEGDAFMLADFEDVLDRLNVASRNDEKAMCFCPAHDDRTSPSLSIKAENGRLLLHCFAGCRLEDIVSKMGLEMKDLFVGGGGGSLSSRIHLHACTLNPKIRIPMGMTGVQAAMHAQSMAARSRSTPSGRSCLRTSCED
jgi:hypothetical protein